MTVQMSLSVVIPTIGRASLTQIMKSLIRQLGAADELVVVGDGNQPDARRQVEQLKCGVAKYVEHANLDSVYGNAQRNFGASVASGDLLWFCDDDDVAMPWSVGAIRKAMNVECPGVFRMEYRGSELWKSREIKVGNIGGPMVVVPRSQFVPFPLTWDKPELSDFEWVRRVTISGCRWFDEIIYRCVQHGRGKK